MSEGLLKKQIEKKMFWSPVMVPAVDVETGEKTIAPMNIRIVSEFALWKIIDKAKKDIENEAVIEIYAYSLTESEESMVIPLRIWKKWLGDST